MNIKQKILAIPLEFGHEEYGSRDLTAHEVRELCAEVAQEYVDKLELAEKYNFEVIQEINAGLEQQLLAERAKMDVHILLEARMGVLFEFLENVCAVSTDERVATIAKKILDTAKTMA